MAHVEFTMVNSILQPRVDGKLIPVKLDTQQVAKARRDGHMTQFMRDSILKKLHKELRDTPGLNNVHISHIMKRFAEALE